MVTSENRRHIAFMHNSLLSGSQLRRRPVWRSRCSLGTVLLKSAESHGNSLLLETVSRLTVTQRFSAKNRHFIGKFHDETKARPFRTYQDHYSDSAGRMDHVCPDAARFLHDPARHIGITHFARPADAGAITWTRGRNRSQPYQRNYQLLREPS